MSDSDVVDAGPFGDWLVRFRRSLRSDGGMEVPCGDCVGCCVSGYAVWVRPEDRRARERIPSQFLSEPPGMPAGTSLMQACDDGTCPMLSAHRCSIYADRPQTCIDYDCRVFAAAGIDAGGDDRSIINKRVREWRFRYLTPADMQAHEAVRAAARFIRDHAGSFPGRAPTAPSGIAVLAVKAYAVFLEPNALQRDSATLARDIIDASRQFDQETVDAP
ncbi:MAG TPA: YkgJ family cysteine cluster protein [Povalibacter sp.]|jgi:hypothetical protein|nr:YkgJ family cysteine cluster protein [Povalibacter sp.]